MRTLLPLLIAALLALTVGGTKKANSSTMELQYPNDTLTRIEINKPQRYLLLPIEERQPEVRVRLVGDRPEDTWLDVRLAVDSIDYYVPLPLPTDKSTATVEIVGLNRKAICFEQLRLSDTFDTSAKDYYRPAYHHSPAYGWMNDPNGMIYKDGIYHLYYQYNPYGSKWGNMYWGHSSSRDLIHWEYHDPALARDTLGHIFSGSAILDQEGIAGFGKDAILAYYTAHTIRTGKQWQAQCLAYSTDNGMTFTKYAGNPILTAYDGVADFRDPKIFWYAPGKSWYMIVSADKEMRFYRSRDLKQWDYVSAFGEGYGARPNQFECPDFFQLRDEKTGQEKWVMIVNINPGCTFGGSATEYFVGSFDGTTFRPETAPEVAHWLDFGKDHYALVTFHNTQTRTIGIPWVSNWQYANVTPFKQTRGMNGLPRELFLFTKKGISYVGARPAREVEALRQTSINLVLPKNIGEEVCLTNALAGLEDSFELEVELTPSPQTKRITLTLSNRLGEQLPIILDLEKKRITMDRTKSGRIDFGVQATPHERESNAWRERDGVNYHNDFAIATWAPLSLCSGKTYKLRLFLDRSMAELFVQDGCIAMTNLIFPREPYTSLHLSTEGGSAQVHSAHLYRLGL